MTLMPNLPVFDDMGLEWDIGDDADSDTLLHIFTTASDGTEDHETLTVEDIALALLSDITDDWTTERYLGWAVFAARLKTVGEEIMQVVSNVPHRS